MTGKDLTGQTLGAYVIEDQIGIGGMAEVYRARHTELDVQRAIKVIRPEFAASEDFRKRFQNEARSVARLDHPNIVRVHDFGEHDGFYYMVMQYVAGRTLKSVLKERGKIPEAEAVGWMLKVADALAYAHDLDIVHRDIKPDNIMLDERGRIVLMDFGVAKLLTAETAMTQTGVGIGTPAYMAPEQAEAGEITPATDVYAACVVLFELLTGRQPYEADTPIAVLVKAINDPLPYPSDLAPHIDPGLSELVRRGAGKVPAERYPSGTALKEALTTWQESGKTPAHAEPTKLLPATDPQPRRKGRSLTFLALLLIFGAALLVWWQFSGDTSRNADTTNAPAAGANESPPENTDTATSQPESSSEQTHQKPLPSGAPVSNIEPFKPGLDRVWTSSWGDLHWGNYYDVHKKYLEIDKQRWDQQTGQYLVIGRWGRRDNPESWGRFEARFSDSCSFTGKWGRGDSLTAGSWSGSCTDQPADPIRQPFEPDLTSPWSSSAGDIHWGRYYGNPNQTMSVDDKGWHAERRQYYVRGRWGRRDSPSNWGQYEFWFDDPCSFNGKWGRKDGSLGNSWSGSCE